MPSDVYAALCLSALDRLSAHVPDIISTAELEALRTTLNEAGEYANAIKEFNVICEQHDINMKLAEEKIRHMTDMLQDIERGFSAREKERDQAFHVDGPIGSALILLRDATLHQPEEGWRKAAMSVLNELFEESPHLTPWNDDDPKMDDDNRPYPLPTPEKQQLMDRFEEAVAIHRVPGVVARDIDMEMRMEPDPIQYRWLQHNLSDHGVDSEKQSLICDLVFMQDGNPDEKISIESDPPSPIPRIIAGISSEAPSEGE
jgi:hypothetical protein